VTPRVLRATAAALVGLAAGSAMVLAHGGDPTRIHACVRLSDSTVRITRDPSYTCKTGTESPVDWNIESAPGAPGPDGFHGPTGPQGPAGPPGHDGADTRLSLRTVDAASPWLAPGTRTFEARCPAGRFAIAGAWRIDDPSRIGEFRALESRPLATAGGWLVRVDGRYAYRGWRLVIEAQCAAQGKAS